MAQALLTARLRLGPDCESEQHEIEFPEILFLTEALPWNLGGGGDEMAGQLWLSRVRICRAFGHSRRMQLKALGSANSVSRPCNSYCQST